MMPELLSNIIIGMAKGGKARLVLSVLLLAAGLSFLVLALGSYVGPSSLYESLSETLGARVKVQGDGIIALSLLLLFQGFCLLRGKGVVPLLFLFLPFFLALSLLSGEKGRLVSFLSALAGSEGSLFVLTLLSLALAFALAFISIPGRRKPEPEAPVKEEMEPAKAEEPPSQEAGEEAALVIAKVLKPSKDDGTYKALQRKRKELMKLTEEERRPFAEGLPAYKTADGKELGLEAALSQMKTFVFSAGFETVNSKGAKKTVEAESMTVPAFSLEEAKALALKEVKAYSKGGYAYTKLSKPLEELSVKEELSYDDFLLPWASDTLRYGEDRTLLAFDFHLKYAKDRGLSSVK